MGNSACVLCGVVGTFVLKILCLRNENWFIIETVFMATLRVTFIFEILPYIVDEYKRLSEMLFLVLIEFFIIIIVNGSAYENLIFI